MTFSDLLRLAGPPLLGAAAAAALDAALVRRGWLPPRLAAEPWRRATAFAVLTGIFWVGVFLPVGTFGLDLAPEILPESVPQLFLLHGLLLLSLGVWFLLGFGLDGRSFASQLGFRVPRGGSGIFTELGVGALAGGASWLAVIVAMLAVALLASVLGGVDALPSGPPAVVVWMAALPVAVRVMLSLSAGVVEETFFRGFLQPRIGLVASTVLFVLPHLSYQSPLMLVAVTLLSLIYGGLVVWRKSVWAAIAAHTLFDAIQLLFVIPAALEMLPETQVPPVPVEAMLQEGMRVLCAALP